MWSANINIIKISLHTYNVNTYFKNFKNFKNLYFDNKNKPVYIIDILLIYYTYRLKYYVYINLHEV